MTENLHRHRLFGFICCIIDYCCKDCLWDALRLNSYALFDAVASRDAFTPSKKKKMYGWKICFRIFDKKNKTILFFGTNDKLSLTLPLNTHCICPRKQYRENRTRTSHCWSTVSMNISLHYLMSCFLFFFFFICRNESYHRSNTELMVQPTAQCSWDNPAH